jgi:polysaccharide export outer membrane protein
MPKFPNVLAALIIYVMPSVTMVATDFRWAIAQQAPTPDSPSRIGPRLPSMPPGASTGSAYTLGAGDRLQITVFQLEQYSGEFAVLVDGTVNLPVVGSVYVEDMTLAQATEAIAAQYAQILRQPTITLNLIARRAIQIGVAGEVNRPGSYTITPEGADFPSLTQVLEQAGGIRMAADLSQVQIRRQGYQGEQTFTINLLELLQSGSLSGDILLRDGDTVFVPTAMTPDLTALRELTEASFATDENREINIVVVGEVFRPGSYTVTGDARTGEAGVPGTRGGGRLPTVTRAIQVAGGIRPLANVRSIEVRRPTRSGQEQIIDVDLWQLLQTGDINQDLVLQDGDTIWVPTATEINDEEAAELASASFSPNTIRINVVGEVARPGVIEVPPNTPLNQGLLAAGGFNNRASRGTIELVRLNLNGTVAAREIPVDFAQGINEDNNPALQNNDVIIVRRSTAASISDTLETIANPVGRFLTLFTVPFTLLRLFD